MPSRGGVPLIGEVVLTAVSLGPVTKTIEAEGSLQIIQGISCKYGHRQECPTYVQDMIFSVPCESS